MKVYVLHRWVAYEGIVEIKSVYTSEEKAKKKAEKLSKGLDPEWDGYSVLEMELVE